jgi:hypothetical protein
MSHGAEAEALETLRECMLFQAGTNDGFGVGTALAWEAGDGPAVADLTALRASMRKLPYDKLIGKADEAERQRLAKRYDQTLAAAEALLDQYAFMTLKGTEHSLNSSALAVPLELPGPVVLDATAGVDLMYDLMEDRADIIPTPRGVRDYSNVTLHVARTERIGKTAMEELAVPRFAALQKTSHSAYQRIEGYWSAYTRQWSILFRHMQTLGSPWLQLHIGGRWTEATNLKISTPQ